MANDKQAKLMTKQVAKAYSSTFTDWYPVARNIVSIYAPGEWGLANALADLLALVDDGRITPEEATKRFPAKVSR